MKEKELQTQADLKRKEVINHITDHAWALYQHKEVLVNGLIRQQLYYITITMQLSTLLPWEIHLENSFLCYSYRKQISIEHHLVNIPVQKVLAERGLGKWLEMTKSRQEVKQSPWSWLFFSPQNTIIVSLTVQEVLNFLCVKINY